jgi:hypothetical protein
MQHEANNLLKERIDNHISNLSNRFPFVDLRLIKFIEMKQAEI